MHVCGTAGARARVMFLLLERKKETSKEDVRPEAMDLTAEKLPPLLCRC
jgi:hypothetical protein